MNQVEFISFLTHRPIPKETRMRILLLTLTLISANILKKL